MFDRVIVAIADNLQKDPFFTAEERLRLVEPNLVKTPNASATIFQGMLVDFARKQGAGVIIRGLRAVSDFEYEFQMALMNRHIEPEIETILVMTGEGYNYTSSSLVKQIASYGTNVSDLVPANVNDALKQRFQG